MKLYSNEIVFRGHPDKVCDQISAAILDACLDKDPNTRAGIEVCGGKGYVFITGEVTTTAKVDYIEIAKRVLKDVGYKIGHLKFINNVSTQSGDIALGVDKGGAGDQGMMFGYACDDTPEYLPTAMVILQKLSRAYDNLRQRFPSLIYPDGKAQITGEYDDNGKLVKIKTFLISYQNAETRREFTDNIIRGIATDIVSAYGLEVDEWLFNPTGRFYKGGFDADAGLTGRKIVVDAYQSFANVGGGCMNGKDPSKVDFSAAHKARQIAKYYVEQYGYHWCSVQLSYAIGRAEPLAIYITTDVGDKVPDPRLYQECTPNRIIGDLGLRRINYEELAKFGHFVD